MPGYNATMVDGAAVPPTRFLFRPAHPAAIGTVGAALTGRDTAGPTCAADETKCSQGDWCCDAGDTCSLENDTFFCCASGEGPECARVCAVGDFQCGSICCANGQTCGEGDTAFPYCVNPTGTLTSSSTPSTTFSTRTLASATSSSVSTPTTSSTRSTTLASATTSPTSSLTPGSESLSDNLSSGGLPLSAQIAMGVVVPVVVILMVIGLWFCLFRQPRRRRPSRHDRQPSPPTPPPAYSKAGGIAVTTTTRGYTFSRARSPPDSPETEISHEMDMLPPVKTQPPVGIAVTTSAAVPSPRQSDECVSPTATLASVTHPR